MATHRRLLSAFISAQTAVLLLSACRVRGLADSSSDAAALRRRPAWNDTAVNAVSRPVIGSGVTAVTALLPDGRLQTVVSDVGERQAAVGAARP